MTLLLPTLTLKGAAVAFLAAVVAHTNLVSAADPLSAIFVNEFPTQTIDLYSTNPSVDADHPERMRFEATIPSRGGLHTSQTFNGQEFSYEVDGQRHYITPRHNAKGESFNILAGNSEGYHVRCLINEYMDSFDIIVDPFWAPRGAARFLELVRSKYYDGVAFHRVLPNFLTQFGIARDYATRIREREVKMWDDFPKKTKFEPGMILFAGNGPDSRTTEIIVVMPGMPEQQLEELGENSWEVPFAVIAGDVNKSALMKIYHGYGDNEDSLANGPDPSKIYEADGYTAYLPRKFPELDYIDSCFIVDEVGFSDELSEGEF